MYHFCHKTAANKLHDQSNLEVSWYQTLCNYTEYYFAVANIFGYNYPDNLAIKDKEESE